MEGESIATRRPKRAAIKTAKAQELARSSNTHYSDSEDNIESSIQVTNATMRDPPTNRQDENSISSQMIALTDLVMALMEQVKAANQQIKTLRVENKELRETLQAEMAKIQTPSATPSYADVARTPPSSRPSNIQTLSSMNTTPTTMTDTLYCTVDTSRLEENDKGKTGPGAIRQAIEKEVRTTDGQETWRCLAVTADPRNPERIRVTCRDEAELRRVKHAATKTGTPGIRVLRDQLYPVKVDNANRSAILDQDGKMRTGVMEMLMKENNVHIAKIAWLSDRENGKAYGSMVVYVTKGSEATRLLQNQYFDIAGESAYTRPFRARINPGQCYRCQNLGHKAHACKKPQKCAKCAQEGHHHSECQVKVSKCALCEGPHPAFSRNCPKLCPTLHE